MARTSHSQSRLLSWAIILVVLVLVGLVALFQVEPVQAADGNPAPEFQGGQGTNELCLGCHQQPRSINLPSGEPLDITVDAPAFATSVHGAAELSCTQCHTNITGYPHPEITASSRAEYSLLYQQTCKNCHTEQFEANQDSMHSRALAGGNLNAPTCSTCHDPHTQQKLTDDSGALLAEARAWVPETCAQCHSAIYDEYRQSVHGAGVVEGNNPDTPTCTDCHGVHSIPDPTTAEFRLNSPRICADCHTDETRMAKYDLSTDVLSTYISDFHGTTVTLFQKQHPDQETNKPVCFDCHGVHNIAATDDPVRGLAMKDNLKATCERCHPGINMNFPDSWLSHYIPSPEHAPLVYYVNLFYRIFIPLVLGSMAIFVLSDIYRKIRRRRDESSQSRSGTA